MSFGREVKKNFPFYIGEGEETMNVDATLVYEACDKIREIKVKPICAGICGV